MNTETLLPCPFCGTQPEWINEALADSHYYIRCPFCHIAMKEDRRDKVIGMWNNRSQLKQRDSEIHQLKFENERFRKLIDVQYAGLSDPINFPEIKSKDSEISELKAALKEMLTMLDGFKSYLKTLDYKDWTVKEKALYKESEPLEDNARKLCK